MQILKKLQLLFLALSIAFIYFFIKNNWATLTTLQFEYQLFPLLISMVFSVFSFVFLASRMKALYEAEDANIRWQKLFKTVAKTNLYRYIPGGVWNHAGLAVSTSILSGKSIKTTSKLQFLNIAFSVYTGAVFGFFVLPRPLNWLLLAVFTLSLFIVNHFFNLINLIWHKFNFKQQLRFAAIRPNILLNIVMNNLGFWLFNGLSFVYFLYGISLIKDFALYKQLYLSSGYILAWLAGFLFLPAPAGIGIREAVLAYFFGSLGLSVVLGVSVSLLYRVFILARDILMYVFSLLFPD